MLVVLADWRGLALRGIFAVLFGIITLIWPSLTILALVLLFGAFALVDGIMILAGTFGRDPAAQERRGVRIFQGILGVGIGIVTLAWPDITALALLWLIAIWAIVTGVLEIAASLALRGEVRQDWLLALVGVLSVIFGILLMITPGAGALVITWLIGWYALISGILVLYVAWRLRQAEAGGGGRIGEARPLAT